MSRDIARMGILNALRRLGGVGAVMFAVVFMIGVLRGEALALTVGDEICIFMGGNLPPRSFPDDPADLADPSHACCDLGQCLTASALPPSDPAPLALPRAVVRLRKARRIRVIAARPLPVDHRPRGPPSSSR